jgi:hypothetical protein
MKTTPPPIQKLYSQLRGLSEMFGVSTVFFESRMDRSAKQLDSDKPFKLGIHYFIPENKSPTKKLVVWHIESVERWFRGESRVVDIQNESVIIDSKLASFLSRTAAKAG